MAAPQARRRFSCGFCFCLQRRAFVNGERGIHGRLKVVCGSKVPVLISHAGLNPRSKHASLSLSASLAALRAGNEREARVIMKRIPHIKCRSKKKGAKKMSNTANEEFRTIYRPPYSVDASASAKMLNKYYDARKDGEIVDVVTLTEPYNIIGHHAFDFCHIKELTLPDTVIRLCRFAFADCKTLKKVTLGKGIKKCGEDLIFRSGVQEVVWTKPIGEDVDEALLSLLYGLIREESTIFYRTGENRLIKGRAFLKTREAQKTFLLTYNGRSVRLPKYINNYINMFVIQGMVHAALASDAKEISRSLSYRLILGTMQDFQNKTSVALELYILEGSSDAKKYLQNNAAKIAMALAEGGDDIALSKFVSLGLMDAEALLQTLPIAQEKELQTSIAYLLEEMRKYGLRLPDAMKI